MLQLALSLLATAPAAAPAAALEDALVLKSGRRLVGRVELADDRGVAFVDERGRSLQLVWSLVRHLERDGEPADLFSADPPPPPDDGYPEAGGYVGYRAPDGEAAGALTTGISRWYHPGHATTLFLVGAVHIGEPAYYRRMQRILDQMDVVLFEGVKPDPDAALTPADLGRLDAVTRLQLTLNRLLGLQFQRDGVAYDRHFWHNADVSVGELEAELDRQGVTLPTDNPLFKMLLRLIAGPLDLAAENPDPGLQRRLRRQLAPVLARADEYTAMPELKGFMDVVVEFRNQTVMEDLAREVERRPPGRRLAIFYGSAHLPDLEERLGAGGWTYQGCTFLDAWTVR